MKASTVLERHSKPGQYDHAPQGTKCRVILQETRVEWYEQRSTQEDEPRWEKVD